MKLAGTLLLGLALHWFPGVTPYPGCSSGGPPPSAPHEILHEQLPKFAKTTLSGAEFSTESSAGRVVVVKFFAKYCKPCIKTLPATERLHRANGDVTFIGIAEDEEQSMVEGMIEEYDITFPVIHDRGNALAHRFKVTQLPATIVADPKGQIVWVGLEGQSEDDLAAAIAWAKSPPTN